MCLLQELLCLLSFPFCLFFPSLVFVFFLFLSRGFVSIVGIFTIHAHTHNNRRAHNNASHIVRGDRGWEGGVTGLKRCMHGQLKDGLGGGETGWVALVSWSFL